MVTGRPVVAAQLSRGQHRPQHRGERVVIALPGAPQITVGPRRRRARRRAQGCSASGLHMPGAAHWPTTASTPRGPGDPAGPGPRSSHRVLLADRQIAPPRPISVGQFAVLIQQQRQPVGGRPQLLGFEPARQLGQIGLRGRGGSSSSTKPGSLSKNRRMICHMLGTRPRRALGRPPSSATPAPDASPVTAIRGPKSLRLRLMRRCRLVLGDPQQRRQCRRQRRLTQLLDRHLGQRRDQTMRHRRQPTRQPSPTQRLPPCAPRSQPVHRLAQQRLQLSTQRRDPLNNSHRTHTSNTSSNHRQEPYYNRR